VTIKMFGLVLLWNVKIFCCICSWSGLCHKKERLLPHCTHPSCSHQHLSWYLHRINTQVSDLKHRRPVLGSSVSLLNPEPTQLIRCEEHLFNYKANSQLLKKKTIRWNIERKWDMIVNTFIREFSHRNSLLTSFFQRHFFLLIFSFLLHI